MSKGKKEIEVKDATEAKLPEAAAVALDADKKPVKQIPVNELVFRKGEELELKGLPFEIAELSGMKLVLKRKDM